MRKSISREGFSASSRASADFPVKVRPGALASRSALASFTFWMASNSLARPGIPRAFSEGDTARQMVFSVRLLSATTRLVRSGSNPRSTHSWEA